MILPVFKKLRKYESDIWAVGVVKAKAADFLQPPLPKDIVWLEAQKSYRYLADPHGIWYQEKLYIFVEALDYRVKKGMIECFILDKDLNTLEHFLVMEHESHLSYPFILEDQGEIYMIPESSRSGNTWIYKATDFPKKWEKVCPVIPNIPMIDASFIYHDGLWWVFYALSGEENRAYKELHIAYADTLLGPWKAHENNPVSVDISLSRPGGRPFIHEGKIHLPVQDCAARYGANINIMRIDTLTPEEYSATKVTMIAPTFHPAYPDGLHSFSGCGAVTLIDCKYLENSPYRNVINLQRRLGRIFPFLRHL